MRPSRLSFVKDPSVADWIAPRLGPFGGQVSSVVPRGFAAYARVRHPGVGSKASRDDRANLPSEGAKPGSDPVSHRRVLHERQPAGAHVVTLLMRLCPSHSTSPCATRAIVGCGTSVALALSLTAQRQWGTFSGLQVVPRLRSPDTVNEVTIMVEATSSTDHKEASASARFRKLPERIRPEDMIATQETEPPPDPTMGRDSERDFMLRNAGS